MSVLADWMRLRMAAGLQELHLGRAERLARMAAGHLFLEDRGADFERSAKSAMRAATGIAARFGDDFKKFRALKRACISYGAAARAYELIDDGAERQMRHARYLVQDQIRASGFLSALSGSETDETMMLLAYRITGSGGLDLKPIDLGLLRR